jgi:hypothetical protein
MQWEPEFVVAAVNKVYYNGEFKENRKAMLTTLEKSRLPDTQNDAKVFLLQEKLDENINISTKQSEIISDIQGENDIKKYQEKIEDISLIISNKSPRKNSDNVLIDKPSNISKILINKINRWTKGI